MNTRDLLKKARLATRRSSTRLADAARAGEADYYLELRRQMQKKAPRGNRRFEEVERLLQSKAAPGLVARTITAFKRRAFGLQTVKTRLLRKTFSGNQPLGMLVINPEMIPHSGKVTRFLEGIGCEVVHEKPFKYSKAKLEQVYGRDFRETRGFYIKGLTLMSAPSRAVVFKLPSNEHLVKNSKYLQFLKAAHPEEHERLLHEARKSPQVDAFNLLFKGKVVPDYEHRPGTIRTDVVRKSLDPEGLERASWVFRTLDAFGYFAAGKGDISNPLPHFSGVHFPENQQELLWNANALLSLRDLKKIGKKVGGVKK